MTKIPVRASLPIVMAALGFALGVPVATAATRTHLHTLRVWSTVGPGVELNGASVKVRDAQGLVIARGTTSVHGTWRVGLSKFYTTALPLTVTTSGGTAKGESFTGHLRAVVYSVGASNPIVNPDLVTTSATVMVANLPLATVEPVLRATDAARRRAVLKRAYAAATIRVRYALRIPKRAPATEMMFKNHYVKWSKLKAAISAEPRGFEGFVQKLVAAAASNRKIASLGGPRRKVQGGPRTPKGMLRQAYTPTMPVSTCPSTVGSGSTTGASPDLVEDFGAAAVGGLLEVAGAPSVLAGGVAGMVLQGIGGADPQPSPVPAMLVQVANQLGCISTQINALQSQVAELTFEVNLDTASNCSSTVEAQWHAYQMDVTDASLTPAVPAYALNASNSTLRNDVANFNNVVTNCGAQINNMLFGTAGGNQGAWQQLVTMVQGNSKWYTQAQVQQLQTFLSYWSSIEYEQFVLSNEFDNYNGLYEEALNQAGGAVSTATAAVKVGAPRASQMLQVRQGGPPTNDNFAKAQILATSSGSAILGTNVAATREPGETTFAAWTPPPPNSVWYRWTAPANGGRGGVLTVEAGASGPAPAFNTMVGLYTGTSVSALTTITENTASLGAYNVPNQCAANGVNYCSLVSASVADGTTWMIAVDGYLSGVQDGSGSGLAAGNGPFTLNYTYTPNPIPPAAPAPVATVEWANGNGWYVPGSPVCDVNSTATTATYCVYASNVANAFPGDLYSDEVGIINSGLAVNSYPAGTNPNYWGRACTKMCANGIEPGTWAQSTRAQSALDAFNAQSSIPGTTNAIETYLNPMALRTTTLTAAQVSALNTAGVGGLTGLQALLNGTNQDPSHAGNTAANTCFYTSDSTTTVQWTVKNGYWKMNMGCAINNWVWQSPNNYSGYGPTTPNMWFLLGRNWWPGAAEASSYVPPPPITS